MSAGAWILWSLCTLIAALAVITLVLRRAAGVRDKGRLRRPVIVAMLAWIVGTVIVLIDLMRDYTGS